LAFVIAADLDWLEQHAVDRDELIDLCVRNPLDLVAAARLSATAAPHAYVRRSLVALFEWPARYHHSYREMLTRVGTPVPRPAGHRG
jgi:hypothetical protein